MSERDNNRNNADGGFSWTAESEKVKERFNGGFSSEDRRTSREPRPYDRTESPVFSQLPAYGAFNGEGLFYDFPEDLPSQSARPAARVNAPGGAQNKKNVSPAPRKKTSAGKAQSGAGKKVRADKRKPASAKNKGGPARGRKKKISAAPKKNKNAYAEQRRKKQIEKSDKDFRRRTQNGVSRDEVRKIRTKEKRRRRKAAIIITVAVFCIAAAAGIAAFCITKGAPIEKIVIDGEKLYSEKEILNAAGISAGDNMLMIRAKKTNGDLTKKLPYISKVKVGYKLPDTLRLTVSETSDKFYIVCGKSFLSLDETNKILSDSKKKMKSGLFRIEGLESQKYEVGEFFVPADSQPETETSKGEEAKDTDKGKEETETAAKPAEQEKKQYNSVKYNRQKFDAAMKLINAVKKSDLKKCSVINVADLDKIYVVYDGRVKLYLKADSDFDYALKFAAKSLRDPRIESAVAISESSYIDLRLGNQAVFKAGELE